MGAPRGNQYAKGNPGPTRFKPVTQQMIAELNELVEELEVVRDGRGKAKVRPTGKQITRMRKMVRAIISAAEDGDVSAFKEIMDRVEGKPVQGVVMAEAGSEAAEAMLAVPENLKDLPQTELVRLFQEVAAKGLGRAREQRANDDEREKSEVA